MTATTKTVYHANNDGEILPCSAKIQCEFDGFHSENKQDVSTAWNERNNKQLKTFSSLKKSSEHKKPVSMRLRDLAEDVNETFKNAIDNKRPLTNDEFNVRKVYVDRVTSALIKNGKETNMTETIKMSDGSRNYTANRRRIHDIIINDLMDKYDHVPCEGKAIFAGGLGGAGKGFILREKIGVTGDNYATVNPDDVKEIMARRGLVPKIKGLTPMEATPLVHEEASDITAKLQRRLVAKKKNIVVDKTMASLKSPMKTAQQLKDGGYSRIQAMFVDVPVETSKSGAKGRWERGVNKYTESGGKGVGGRFLPDRITDAQKTEDDSQFKSKNAKHFIDFVASGSITETPIVWDNSNRSNPQKINISEYTKKSIDNFIIS